jgi:hypothetical protein
MKPEINDTAVICGNHINAHTLIGTLKRLGWIGRIVFLYHATESGGFTACLNPEIDAWRVSIDNPDELPSLIEKRIGSSGRAFVFFTDERYHMAFASWQNRYPSSSLRFYVGSVDQMQTILDRYEFCLFIGNRKLASVPLTISGDEDPFKIFGNSFIVRPRLSWFSIAQREKVALVSGRTEYASVLSAFYSRGLSTDDLCYQELLSIRNQDNVSVCGWFGQDRQHLYCSRKVLQYPPKTGGGDVVELLEPRQGLIDIALNILSALSYEGPFELEFVFDEKAKEFKVTELNPRFWLQHGLIENVSGCVLASTYLGQKQQLTTTRESKLRYWVNPLYTGFRAFKGDFRSLLYFVSRYSWAPFSLLDAARYGVKKIMNKNV